VGERLVTSFNQKLKREIVLVHDEQVIYKLKKKKEKEKDISRAFYFRLGLPPSTWAPLHFYMGLGQAPSPTVMGQGSTSYWGIL